MIGADMNTWLEIGPCEGISPAIVLDLATVRTIPTLAEAFSAAQKAGSNGRYSAKWDYSLRITQGESHQIKDAIKFTRKSEDDRSIVYSADVSYSNSCYTVRLFIDKSQ